MTVAIILVAGFIIISALLLGAVMKQFNKGMDTVQGGLDGAKNRLEKRLEEEKAKKAARKK